MVQQAYHRSSHDITSQAEHQQPIRENPPDSKISMMNPDLPLTQQTVPTQQKLKKKRKRKSGFTSKIQITVMKSCAAAGY